MQGAVAVLEKGIAGIPIRLNCSQPWAELTCRFPTRLVRSSSSEERSPSIPRAAAITTNWAVLISNPGALLRPARRWTRARVLSTDASEAKMGALSKDQTTEAGTDGPH